MSKCPIWGNDEKYSKEFQIAYRKSCEEDQRKWEETKRRRAEAEAKLPIEQRPGCMLNKFIEDQHSQGNIVDPFIKQYLEGRITAARWILAIAMAITLLFKGFWALWIVFILLYKWEVKRIKEEAFKTDLKRGTKNERLD